jgi:acetyl/propionyl-CoA carboxylase alpha subunit
VSRRQASRQVSLRKDSTDGPPFAKVLVANRGEIARRLIRACHELGCATVAVYSDADADALHVAEAGERVRIGPPPPSASYLSVAAIIDAARGTGATAIHPGYGFLSEQPALAEACAAAGIVFVGPRPRTLAELGNKLAARAAAAKVGVPTVPGTLGAVTVGMGEGSAARGSATDALRRQADGVGYPLLIKAAAGGGGRGMRRVDDPAELVGAAVAASNEAAAAFGDGAIYIERYVERARHVEVQLLGDELGTIVALGERDCSIQRRHQKLVEEAPAPGIDAGQRRRLHGLGVEVARAVGLLNAATAEFLLTPSGEFWFLEVNARLQVEHGVTELVSGVDLVHEQLWLAAGRPLSPAVMAAAERAAEPVRHAIEARISAEDPAHDFGPAPGLISRWRPPAAENLRVDDGVAAGSLVSTHYDPLLAKLMAVGPDRATALARLAGALADFEIGGVQTTLPFHRWLLEQPGFAAAIDLSTDFVARAWQPAPLAAVAALSAAEAVAAAWPVLHAQSEAERPTADGGSAWWRDGLAAEIEERLR